MALENGVNWKPVSPELRGKHKTFSSALDAVFHDLRTEHNPFFDSLSEIWERDFSDILAKPGRYENGIIFLYVKSPSVNFMLRPKLRLIKKRLEAIPGAPKKFDVKLEIKA
jgi:hypothetical protein